ncbi:hypothetical protein A3D78_05670 [Candidatus Gottesmanbacteria bacterium RIFCSPHIGHO2_02_FULL_39_14]|uniref:Uncharacterized protein n=1 Tax=Candidatus Gottesmanbacteria bacterium RIFCSPHIGHO2_02_FULL_39_14 TaxID=1798383 RepID=A0A1F6A2L9_9BACT|nr:MAG: hypothetical protein A3D78_05670 [Candidatus Gottesmanbacteria bacterium RIFCSPHIGHO2_02_FULL_39_14]
MRIEIDQSGKVEATAIKTVIADSKGHYITFSAVDKQSLQHIYRLANRPRMFVYEVFSVLVAIIIKQTYSPENSYTIDTEYLHQDDLIINLILQYLKKMKIYPDKDYVSISQIGKKSEAHKLAYLKYKTRGHPKKIKIDKILKILLQ